MYMQKFYNEYNLSKERFAEVCGVNKQSITKYEQDDETLSKKTRDKIEKIRFTIEKCKLRHPPIDHNTSSMFAGFSRRWNREMHNAYIAKVRHLSEKVEA